jgi:O-methyltransferase
MTLVPAQGSHEADRAWVSERLDAGLRPLTMLPVERLHDLVRQVDFVETQGVPGAFVECGTWRGGASFLMGLRAPQRRLWMFDSFEGLPPPAPIDGPAAQRWAHDVDGPDYYDNCRATVEEVKAHALRLGLQDRVEIVKGWFEDTLPTAKERIGPVALLRLDADWYESVRTCLHTLFDLVVPGGFVVIDDYYDWDGCAIAVHEFLAERRLPYRIYQGACAFIQIPQ